MKKEYTEAKQIKMVNRNGYAIEHIKNPSEKIRKLALMLYPEMI